MTSMLCFSLLGYFDDNLPTTNDKVVDRRDRPSSFGSRSTFRSSRESTRCRTSEVKFVNVGARPALERNGMNRSRLLPRSLFCVSEPTILHGGSDDHCLIGRSVPHFSSAQSPKHPADLEQIARLTL